MPIYLCPMSSELWTIVVITKVRERQSFPFKQSQQYLKEIKYTSYTYLVGLQKTRVYPGRGASLTQMTYDS